MNAPAVTIRALPAPEARARLPELATILVDAVAGGASVNFLADVTPADATAFWETHLAGLAARDRVLLVAEAEGSLIGTALLLFAPQPNQRHRADVGKMLVLRAHRRQGVARRLLEAVEAEAQVAGRTLLMLDTQTGSAAEVLYRACGWIPYGVVPDHALQPHGVPAPTTFFFKRLTA